MATDSLNDTPEFIESVFGEALSHRTSTLGQITGLGPPDLCSLHKVFERPYVPLLNQQSRTGYYHYVIGVDTSSPAAVSAYFGDLLKKMEPASWYSGGSWRIEGGCFAAYNAFSRVDVRVEMAIPGGVKYYAVDAAGKRYETTDAHWREVYVCCMLRAMGTAPPVPCLKTFGAPFHTPKEEEAFLALVADMFDEGHRLGCDVPTTGDDVHVANRMMSTVFAYLMRFHKYDQCLAFFNGLAAKNAAALVYVAAVYTQLGEKERTVELLTKVLETCPTSLPALQAQARFLLEEKQVAFALSLARNAVQLGPTNTLAWLLLSRVYSVSKAFDLALVSLNVTPIPADAADHVTGVLRGSERTYPNGADAAEGEEPGETPTYVGEEFEYVDDDQSLQLLPASKLKGLFAQAYGILVDVMNDAGWEKLLDLRGRCFIMEKDRSAAAAKKKEENEGEGGGGEKEEGGGDGAPKKRLCTRWLDSLFHALYEDLSAFAQWKAQTEAAKVASGASGAAADGAAGATGAAAGAAAAGAAGGADAAAAGGTRAPNAPAAAAVPAPVAPPASNVDWVGRGLLAQRLKRPVEAEFAFRSAVAASANRRAWRALLCMYAESGRVKETLIAAAQLLRFHSATKAADKKGKGAKTTERAPPSIVEAVHAIIAKAGMKAVRAEADQLEPSHPLLVEVLEEAHRWCVYGHDR